MTGYVVVCHAPLDMTILGGAITVEGEIGPYKLHSSVDLIELGKQPDAVVLVSRSMKTLEPVPEELKDNWYYRRDLTFRISSLPAKFSPLDPDTYAPFEGNVELSTSYDFDVREAE
ncbi:MAG: hypothetical protein AAFQ66_17780 [Pseudomonadota bacterium]